MFFNFRRFAAVEYPTLICSTTQAINTLPTLATYSFALLTFFCASAGNYFVEMCRVLIYIFLPVAFVLSIINCEHDSLNPVAVLSPMVGMWLNCIVDGKGFGVINMLLFWIAGVFIAGQMVGRTPEYLVKKIGGREMKLAMIALLVHPIMILFPTGGLAC